MPIDRFHQPWVLLVLLAGCSDVMAGVDNVAVDGEPCPTAGSFLSRCQVGLVCLDGLCQSVSGPPIGTASKGSGGTGPSGPWTVGSVTIHDHATKLAWQRHIDTGAFPHADALAYCQGLGMRLPTYAELQALVRGTACPTIDTQAFPGTPCEPFWTATPVAGPQHAWNVNFAQGTSSASSVAYFHRVRCVRGP